MSQTIALSVGIDISKDRLDVAVHPGGDGRSFANDKTGLRQLVAWLAKLTPRLIVFEATGPYHRDLEQGLAKAALAFAKVNPRQARRFAEATGKLAKTDRADALMLARLAALMEPQVRPMRSPALEQLAELVAARRLLTRDRTAMKNRAQILRIDLLKRQACERLKQIAAQIDAIDAMARDIVDNDPALARRFAILVSIPGLGPTTAFALLADMPELGQMDQRQAAALAGLAPITRQSGKWQGKAAIRGGRRHLRQAIYMPALVAARFNPQLRATFDRLVAKGKPAKVAITAVMRKIVVLANALIRDDRTWTNAKISA